jgi:hypothetical protein
MPGPRTMPQPTLPASPLEGIANTPGSNIFRNPRMVVWNGRTAGEVQPHAVAAARQIQAG